MKSHILTIDFCLYRYTESRLLTETLKKMPGENCYPNICINVITYFFFLTSLLLPLDSLCPKALHSGTNMHQQNLCALPSNPLISEI